MRRLATVVLVTVVVGLFGGLMTASAGVPAYPPLLEIIAPWVCPAETVDTVVVTWSERTSSGTGYSFDLYCLRSPGQVPFRPQTVRVWFTVAALGAAVVGAVVLFFGLLGLTFGARRRDDRTFAPPSPPELLA
jgi:hypothetical protein